MPSYSKKERERYNEHRERVSKEHGFGKNEYNALRRIANSLSDADTNYANGTKGSRSHYEAPKYEGNKITNEYTEKHYKGDVNKAFAKTKALKKKLKDVHYYHQSDPRGASLYVAKKRLNSQNYSSEGHHIY